MHGVERLVYTSTPSVVYNGRDLAGADGKPDFKAFAVKLKDPERRMMGQGQEQWLAREVNASVKAGVAWQVLGNQVVMARVASPDLKAQMGEQAYAAYLAKLPPYVAKPVEEARALSPLDVPGNLDAWDGYPADRARVYDIFKAGKARPIVLAGDSHAFWVNELWDDAGTTRVAAEFGVTSVTSPGYGDYLPGAPVDQAFVARNKEVKFTDQAAKGYLLLTLEHGRATGELVAVPFAKGEMPVRRMQLVSWAGRPQTPMVQACLQALADGGAETLVPDGAPVLALGPAANWHAKTWPAERFVELTQRLLAWPLQGWRVAVFAAPDERHQVQGILDAFPDAIDAVGWGNPAQVVSALARCALFIGNDSGLMHMAAALDKKTLGLFGPTYDEIYGPWKGTVVRTPQSVSELLDIPDYNSKTCPNLMTGLSVEAVETAVKSLI